MKVLASNGIGGKRRSMRGGVIAAGKWLPNGGKRRSMRGGQQKIRFPTGGKRRSMRGGVVAKPK